MARDVVQELVQVMSQKLKLDAAGIAPDTRLFEGGLELDSFAVVELVTTFETHFDIVLADDDFVPDSFKDVRTLAGVVEKYLAA